MKSRKWLTYSKLSLERAIPLKIMGSKVQGAGSWGAVCNIQVSKNTPRKSDLK